MNGTWRKAIAVPGTIALNIGGMARVTSVSCASAGNCSAGGNYANGASFSLAFIDNEVHGHWGMAIEVPGTSPRSLGESSSVSSVSCGAAGNCSAGGFRTDSAANEMPYVVSEVNGIWRRAAAVPGMTALGGYGWGAVRSMSCSSATSCGAGGSYFDSSENPQPFVVNKS